MLKAMKSDLSGKLLAIAFVCLISVSVFPQNITNTLGAGGSFIIKDGAKTFLTLNQSTGYLTLNSGVIFKGADRFIHNYSPDSAYGYNTFIGINSGNFTMTGAYNLALGEESLFSNQDGFGNTALGFQSLYSNTTGFQNTAVGLGFLQNNTTAYNNTAVGYLSLNYNNTGYGNTALGSVSLQSNTTGYDNIAIGNGALNSNTGGFNNTAVGVQALFSNTIGERNTAVGYQSLFSNIGFPIGFQGIENTAVGIESLYSNTSGFGNTASGDKSLYSNTSGYGNTALGFHSLYQNSTGIYNTALGYGSGVIINGGINLTCLGSGAEPTSINATNQITLGDNNITSLRCYVTAITALSDARDKKNIKDLNLGIDFLMKIKPRQFNWDKREWYDDNKSNGSKMKEEPTAGFIAQELDEVQTTQNSEWLNLVLKDNPEKWEATPGNLLPIIVKAIQDLKKENDELKIKNEHFQTANDELKTTTIELTGRLTKFEQIQNILVTEIEKLKINNNESVNVSLGEK